MDGNVNGLCLCAICCCFLLRYMHSISQAYTQTRITQTRVLLLLLLLLLSLKAFRGKTYIGKPTSLPWDFDHYVNKVLDDVQALLVKPAAVEIKCRSINIHLDGDPNVERINADLVSDCKLGGGGAKTKVEQSHWGCRGEERWGTWSHIPSFSFSLHGKFSFYQVRIIATMAAAADPCLSFY